MTSLRKLYSRGLFFCLAASLLITNIAFASDKKTSAALSHYIMGLMQDRLGDTQKAILEYKTALKSDYENPAIHLGLAACYIKSNDIINATDELKLTAKINPDAVEPHAVLALLYSAQNKVDDANREYEAALQNAVKLEPKNVEIYKTLGLIYLQQKKLPSAESTYKLIIDLAPGDAEAHFYLANVYDLLKKPDLAEQELKKSLELNPDYGEALNYLGYTYVEANKSLDSAETMIKKALKGQPDNGAFVDSLGWLYFKKGKAQAAVKELERAVTLMEDPVIYDHLGDVYFKLGDTEKAKAVWQKSLAMDPAQESVKKKLESPGKN